MYIAYVLSYSVLQYNQYAEYGPSTISFSYYFAYICVISYAKCQIICRIMQKCCEGLYRSYWLYSSYICTPHFADGDAGGTAGVTVTVTVW